jgi:hypothetical protein
MQKIVLSLVALFILGGACVLAQETPTLTVVNLAGESANVRVVGPTSCSLVVGPGARRTVAVSGGTYHLKVNTAIPGAAAGTRRPEPSPSPTRDSVSEITVTLHSSGGNLDEHGITEAEFNASY